MKGLTRLDECIIRRLAESKNGMPFGDVDGVAIGLLSRSEAHFRIADATAGSLKALRLMGLIAEDSGMIRLTEKGKAAAAELGPGDFESFFAARTPKAFPVGKADVEKEMRGISGERPVAELGKSLADGLASFGRSVRRLWKSL